MINFKEKKKKKFKNSFRGNIFSLTRNIFQTTVYETNDTRRSFMSVESLNREFLSSILHIIPQIYPIFTCVDPDPYSEYESRSKKLMRMHKTAREGGGVNLD